MKSLMTNTDNTTFLGRNDPLVLSEKWLDELGIDVGVGFRSLSEIELWQCNDTGLLWYEPAEAAGSGELYAQLESHDWYYMPEKWEFSTALGLLSKGDRILEVGVGFGFFLEACRIKKMDISGVELNPSAAKRSRDKGFDIFEGNLDDLERHVGPNQFDVICSFQVLEHVGQPGEFIQGMLRNLKIGGRLVLSVPDFDFWRKIDPKHEDILNQPPHHMSHWNEDVFKSLESLYRVELRRVFREPLASYHVDWVISRYMRHKFEFIGEALTRLLFNRITLAPVSAILRAGLRKRISGHTLLVELEKIE